MPPKEGKAALTRAAQIISDVFSPIVIPTYMMAMAMWITPLVVIPERTRLAAMGTVALLTAIIPTATLFTLIRMGRAGAMCLNKRQERTIPFAISVLCYIVAAFYLNAVNAPRWLSLFYVGAAVTSAIALAINFKWKISVHAASAGGITAAVAWLAFNDLLIFGSPLWLSGMILICGTVGSARLILERHTLGQVIAGSVLGATAIFVSMCML